MSPLELLIVGWSLLASGFSLLAWWRLGARRQMVDPGPVSEEFPPLLLLRPVDEPTSSELALLAEPVDYPGDLAQVVVSTARVELKGAARWVQSDPGCPNRKVGHLRNGLLALPPEGRVVVTADADVRVTGELLRSLVAGLRRGADLCTAAPLPLRGEGLGSRATRAVLLSTHHNFLALDALRAGAPAVCGKAMALSPMALGELSGLQECVGEDLELARRLHLAGRAVVLADRPAEVVQGSVSLRASLQRFTRWMVVLKAHRPALYPTVALLFVPALPLLALALLATNVWAQSAVALLWLARSALSRRLGRSFDQAHSLAGGLGWVGGEALLLLAFARSIPLRTVVWRGRTLEIRRGGLMRYAPETK